MIDENLLVVVTHAAVGDFQVRCNCHRLVDRKKRVEIVVLKDVTAHFSGVSAGFFLAHFENPFDTVSSVGGENKQTNNYFSLEVTNFKCESRVVPFQWLEMNYTIHVKQVSGKALDGKMFSLMNN